MSEAHKGIVLVDQDAVLAGFDTGAKELLAAEFGDAFDPGPQDRKIFPLVDAYPDYAEFIRKLFSGPEFFRNLPLEPGAKEGWDRISELGYHPVVATAAIRANPFCQAEKREWLAEHFGQQAADEALFERQKYLLSGIALIDDNPAMVRPEGTTWQHLIFDQSYNRHIAGPRLHGWSDETLEAKLDDARGLYIARFGTQAIRGTNA